MFCMQPPLCAEVIIIIIVVVVVIVVFDIAIVDDADR